MNPDSPRLEDHFGPHCFRHWFTAWLLRNRMPREYVKEISAYENTITSIKVVKYYPWGTETRWYEMPIRGFGHAVVKTSLDD
ncbi:MAG: hypothetical protein QXU68_01095, partial [Candidatus Bathyarchaeia archaeon]